MLKVAYLHFPDRAAARSGWYICDAAGAILAGTARHEHHASAVRAASALANAPALT